MSKGGLNIYKRKDGRYEGRYIKGVNPKNGKTKFGYIYGNTEKEVKTELIKITHEINSGTYIEKSNLTLGNWLDEWLETYAKPHIKPSTYVSYHTYINKHIKPEIGKIKLSSLRADMLQRFFNMKAATGRLDKAKNLDARHTAPVPAPGSPPGHPSAAPGRPAPGTRPGSRPG
jgi:hypothetical protein